jgi:hypothetical protein
MAASDLHISSSTTAPGGSLRRMAELIAEGVERVQGAQARLRTVPKVVSIS